MDLERMVSKPNGKDRREDTENNVNQGEDSIFG